MNTAHARDLAPMQRSVLLVMFSLDGRSTVEKILGGMEPRVTLDEVIEALRTLTLRCLAVHFPTTDLSSHGSYELTAYGTNTIRHMIEMAIVEQMRSSA